MVTVINFKTHVDYIFSCKTVNLILTRTVKHFVSEIFASIEVKCVKLSVAKFTLRKKKRLN